MSPNVPPPGLDESEDRVTESSAIRHHDLLEGVFWQRLPAYAKVTEREFLDHRWQAKHSVTRLASLLAVVGDIVPRTFVRDAEQGLKHSPMSFRVSPYLLSLIDWSNPYEDALRIQFIPLQSRRLPDHPEVSLDSLREREDEPVASLIHRYADRALLVALNRCPVYCRFCTRSYTVGSDTDAIQKRRFRASMVHWGKSLDHVRAHSEIEDLVISGGDVYLLPAAHIEQLGEALLGIPHVRRVRFATRGLAAIPQKILSDHKWTDALSRVVEKGRAMHKEVALHVHFNHPNEITGITKTAANLLSERGIIVRNQSVLLRGVNDSPKVMIALVKRMGHLNIHPYYVYLHDLVPGAEDLRTSLDTAIHVEKCVRGTTAGFNTPTFVVDAPGGGGKRDIHSFESYDPETGVSVFQAPSVRPGKFFLYFDPLDQLSPDVQRRWHDPRQRDAMKSVAISRARAR